MTTKPLLPNNTTKLEKLAAQAMQYAVQNPIIIAELINPQTCPVKLLPYLAWALSVDKWDEDWTDEQKRLVITQSYLVHKYKNCIN